MTLPHREAADQLEAFVLGALDDGERDAVERHLVACAECRAAAADLTDVTTAMWESLPPREPSPALRERILAAARADVRRPRRRIIPFIRPAFALAAALVLVSSGALYLGVREAGVTRERDAYRSIAYAVSEGGRWWYMAGTDRFKGSGGTLIDSRSEGRAFVLFHDLPSVAAGQRLAVWLIKPDGSWTRATAFVPDGSELQRIDLPLQVADFDQCAVTLESSDAAKPAGPTVMQSRVFAAQ